MAPMVWGKFHHWCHSSASCHQPCSVVGGNICLSRYSSTMASQTSLTTKLIVLWGTLHAYCMSLYLAPEYCMSLYLAPDARWRRVSATFKTGSRGVRQLVVCLVILGVSLSTISSNMAGGILIKFLNDLWSSFRSSTIKQSYRPCSTLRPIHGLTQTLLCLLLLLLRLRFRSCWSWTSSLLCCYRRNTSTSCLWGFIVISSGTHVQRCVLLGGLVQTGGGMKDRPIYIYIRHTIRESCLNRARFISDSCVSYVILTRYVRRIRYIKVIHLWYVKGLLNIRGHT